MTMYNWIIFLVSCLVGVERSVGLRIIGKFSIAPLLYLGNLTRKRTRTGTKDKRSCHRTNIVFWIPSYWVFWRKSTVNIPLSSRGENDHAHIIYTYVHAYNAFCLVSLYIFCGTIMYVCVRMSTFVVYGLVFLHVSFHFPSAVHSAVHISRPGSIYQDTVINNKHEPSLRHSCLSFFSNWLFSNSKGDLSFHLCWQGLAPPRKVIPWWECVKCEAVYAIENLHFYV